MIHPPMMKQDPNPTTTATTATTTNHPTLTTVCGQCGIEERKLLHNVRLRGNFRRLCTTCVLRLHPQCFCPSCLGVYDRSPPDDAIICYKCYSASHPNCITISSAGPVSSSRGSSPSPCSSCLNPSLLVLNLSRLDSGGRSNGGRVIDGVAARLLFAAGKIAAMSMSKAEVAAGMEAERRAKEAAYTKKRAREALDHVVRLMGKEKRVVGGGESGRKGVVGNGNVVKKVEESNEVLEALNAVELKDNGTQVSGGGGVVGSVVSDLQGGTRVKGSGGGVERVVSEVQGGTQVIGGDGGVESVVSESQGGTRMVGGGVVESVVSGSQGDGVVVMEVDVGGGKDSGLDSVAENGSVKNEDLVKSVENGEEQSVEKIQALAENNVSNPKN